MALADIDLEKRSEQSGKLDGTQHDSNLTKIENAIALLNDQVNDLDAAKVLVITAGGKVGATAGWSVNDAANRAGLAKLPASQTASTLVVPISGLVVGQVLTGYTVRGQVESAGGAVTLDAALRSLTVAAADLTDAAVTSGAITQVAVTADTSVASAVTGLALTIAAGVTYYLLLTGTTAGSTDIDLASIDLAFAAT
jgi:hypothetical protein